MIIDDLIIADKANKAGKKNEDIYAAGYYTGGGMLLGILLNQYWEQLGLPGNDTKVTESILTHNKIENSKGMSTQKLIQTVFSVAVMCLELFNVKGAAASGAGLLLGFTFMSTSKKGEYVGMV